MRGAEQIPWVYDLGMWVLERGSFARWREWLVAGARGRVLDVGAGTGRSLPGCTAAVTVAAVDPCLPNLRAARKRAPGALLACARAEALPFRDGAFDTVVSGLAFCTVAEPERGLVEVRRVLAACGTFRMLEHVRSTSAFWARVQDAIQPGWTAFTGGCHPNRDTEAAVAAAGFVVLPGERRARGTLRRLVAVPAASPSPR